MSDARATLTLRGELDLLSQGGLAELLSRMEAVPHLLIVDLAAVTFADGYGLRPLFDSARRRRDARLPALLLSRPGAFLAQVLCALGAQRVFDTEHREPQARGDLPAVWYAC